ERSDEAGDLVRDIFIAIHNAPVGFEFDYVSTLVVGDAVGVLLALRGRQVANLVEDAECAGGAGVWNLHAGEGEATVDCGHGVTAGEEVERPTGGEVEEIPAHVAVVEVA